MSAFFVNVVAVNLQNESRMTEPIESLVESGADKTRLPADQLRLAGIEPRRHAMFSTATGEEVRRPIGYAIVRYDGFETIDEVVFGEAGDAVLLGVRTLEGFSVDADFIGHRFLVRPTRAV